MTPIIETVRGLLLGTPTGDSWWQAIVWFGGITLAGTSSRPGCSAAVRRAE